MKKNKINTLHVYTDGGLSGDMFLAAFLDLGIPINYLKESFRKISGLPPFKFEIEIVNKAGISAKRLVLDLPDEKKSRSLSDIEKLIQTSYLSPKIKKYSTNIFRRIGKAEAKIHNVELNKVTFHEVGALDSIIDIVGFCVSLEYFSITKIYCEALIFGSGYVQCHHGKLPVPTPAVVEITKKLPQARTHKITGELVTPTGAALMASSAVFPPFDSDFSNMVITDSRIGYGAGQREYSIPNVLRIKLDTRIVPDSDQDDQVKVDFPSYIKDLESSPKDNILSELHKEKLYILETNLDDINPELFENIYEKSLGKFNALDTWITPIQMKKNRPAFQLCILCTEKYIKPLAELILTETSSLGFRINEIIRYCMKREIKKVKIGSSVIRVKKAFLSNGFCKYHPEYEDCRQASIKENLPLTTIMAEANRLSLMD